MDQAMRTSTFGLATALAITSIAALVPMLVVRQFASTFDSFGVDLPWITRIAIDYHLLLWLVPPALLALWMKWDGDARRGARIGAIGVALGVASILFFTTAMYLPVFKLAAAI